MKRIAKKKTPAKKARSKASARKKSETKLMAANAPDPVATRCLAILQSARIVLATTHSSGNVDHANARQNIVDGSEGRQARRSAYDGAPGGTTPLSLPMLDGLLALDDDYTVHLSEIAGGKHSATSRHYVGVALDVTKVNGAVVAEDERTREFMQRCRALGATEVLGPGDPGHGTHVHAAWPRP